MDAVQLKKHLVSKPEAVVDYPFGHDIHVFKVAGKMFALLAHRDGADQLNLKCEPHEALALRMVFNDVQPGYHMNKKHWNTVRLRGDVPDSELVRMIDRSYSLVIQGLKSNLRRDLELRHGPDKLYQ
ncbi:putative DNA-binding protein (MmcQ/YjbR family) [Sinobacterium caligoides]|uniref:Putative DNA-binding protein (MmcQ/YjbR family) n=1 Tax=Sinobacterium caligoides TaxID=933926 RepID=A0A3N2DPZ2_9GAMM|nr:MmcQ/YjbR family DNA-binding protein [Sinobacterium caligoides]ROS01888.1 putative DNA-binding protein (MmcQ/YjbR family) [Sinobacterium caligoides]